MVGKINTFYINIAYVFLVIVIYFYNINIFPYFLALYMALVSVYLFMKRKERFFSWKTRAFNLAFGIYSISFIFLVIFRHYLNLELNKNLFLFLFTIPTFLFFIVTTYLSTNENLGDNFIQLFFNIITTSVIIFIIFTSIFVPTLSFSVYLDNFFIFLFFYTHSLLQASVLYFVYKESSRVNKNLYKYFLMFALLSYSIGSLFHFQKMFLSISIHNLCKVLFVVFIFFYVFSIENIKYKGSIWRSSLKTRSYSKMHYFYVSSNFLLFITLFLLSFFTYKFAYITNHTYLILIGLSTFNLSVNLIYSYGYFNDRIVEKEKQENLKLEFYMLDQIENLKQINIKLKRKIAFDSVTGLHNIGSLYTKINDLIAETVYSFSVMAINIDDFKTLNNFYGHDIGDEILIETARRLKDEFTDDSEFVFRLDSDEFAVLFKEISFEAIEDVSLRIKNVLDLPLDINNKKFHINYSTSIVRYPLDAVNVEEIVQGLSVAMEESKKFKNKQETVYFSTSLIKSMERKNDFENYFRNVKIENDFTIMIHPYYDVKKDKITVIRPFLKCLNKLYEEYEENIHYYVENIGFLEKMIIWFIDKLGNDILSKIHENKDIEKISIRIFNSADKVVDYLPIIIKKMDQYSIPYSMLDFEVKGELLDDLYNNHSSTLTEIRQYGIGLIVRNFGIGYTSFYYIKECEVDKLFIDKSLMTNIDMSYADLNMLESVMNIAKGIGLSILVEGVERISQFYSIRKFDCDYASGSYIGDAIEVNDFFDKNRESFKI